MGVRQTHHAREVGMLTRGTPDEVPATSLYINPQKSQEEEKFDIQSEIKDRLTANLTLIGTQVLDGWFKSNKLQQWATGAKFLTDTENTVKNIKQQLGRAMIAYKDIMANGWRLTRVSQAVATVAGDIIDRANRVIYREAPIVVDTASALSQHSNLHNITTDVLITTCREDIKRVAGTVGLEADYLIALVKTAIILKSADNLEVFGKTSVKVTSTGDIEIGSTGDLSLGAQGDISLVSGGKLKLGGLGGVEVKGSGVDIGASGGINIQAGTTASVHGIIAASLLSTGAVAVNGTNGSAIILGFSPAPPVAPGLLVPPAPATPPVAPPDPELIVPSGELRATEELPSVQGLSPLLSDIK